MLILSKIFRCSCKRKGNFSKSFQAKGSGAITKGHWPAGAPSPALQGGQDPGNHALLRLLFWCVEPPRLHSVRSCVFRYIGCCMFILPSHLFALLSAPFWNGKSTNTSSLACSSAPPQRAKRRALMNSKETTRSPSTPQVTCPNRAIPSS